MKATIDDLIDIIIKRHDAVPPLNSRSISRHESRLGYPFPSDLHRFYERCNGAELFVNKHHYHQFRLLPLREVKRTRIYIFGQDLDEFAPESWYAICDAMDGNYIGVDLAKVTGNKCPIIDCFHETHGIAGEDKIIAKSFSEFLELMLKSRGQSHWLGKSFRHYGPALK